MLGPPLFESPKGRTQHRVGLCGVTTAHVSNGCLEKSVTVTGDCGHCIGDIEHHPPEPGGDVNLVTRPARDTTDNTETVRGGVSPAANQPERQTLVTGRGSTSADLTTEPAFVDIFHGE